jgi:hypothetical protein
MSRNVSSNPNTLLSKEYHTKRDVSGMTIKIPHRMQIKTPQTCAAQNARVYAFPSNKKQDKLMYLGLCCTHLNFLALYTLPFDY